MRQRIAILGSTGSIGEQTLEVLRLYPELFEVTTLVAKSNWKRLVEQAREFVPESVIVGDEDYYGVLKDALRDLPVKVYCGRDAVETIGAESNVDVVVNALVGYAGLAPTVKALKAGKKLALANKESLVVAGELVMGLVGDSGGELLPIDSEHSAILQCLMGEISPVRRIILTASGGALRDVPMEELSCVSVQQALAHPNWSMGRKITIDSATMVNKGFEVIEARWLFGLPSDRIDVVIHPQSVVHSMVEFEDGAIKAQLGTPDMRVPIAYALSVPERLFLGGEKFAFQQLTFAEVDAVRYPALGIAKGCLAAGGTACCAMNAANEVAVEAFLAGRTGFLDIVRTIEDTLERVENISKPTLGDYINVNSEARIIAETLIY